jgi:phage baseplate assembly protein V
MSAPAISDGLRLGKIIEVDLASALVRVAIGEIESDWIDWAAIRAGDTQVWSPPSVGEQTLVVAPDGDLEGAFALGGLFSDLHPAAGNSLRELIKFKDGTVLAYDPENHELEVYLCAGGKATITAPAGLTINGDVTVNGKIDATGDVKAGTVSLQQHKHVGVQAGGAQSGVPV